MNNGRVSGMERSPSEVDITECGRFIPTQAILWRFRWRGQPVGAPPA